MVRVLEGTDVGLAPILDLDTAPAALGGLRLVPDRWEFWQGRKRRLSYRRDAAAPGAPWLRERLAP